MTLHHPGWRIEWHGELESTMERAGDLAAEGAPAGTVVAADFQRRGRGTHGRDWRAPAGSCLMFTAIVRPSIALERLPGLPLDIACSISAFLRGSFDLDAVVSAPNDIEIGRKKVCGILCTSRITGERLDWVLFGAGLNTFMTTEQLPVATATSLKIEGAADIPSHPRLLDGVLGALDWLLDSGSLSCAGYADKPIL